MAYRKIDPNPQHGYRDRFDCSIKRRTSETVNHFAPVYDSMAIRADKREIVYVRFLARRQRGDWLRMVALDKTTTTLTVHHREVEATSFTCQAAIFLKDLPPFAFDQAAVPLPGKMNPR